MLVGDMLRVPGFLRKKWDTGKGNSGNLVVVIIFKPPHKKGRTTRQQNLKRATLTTNPDEQRAPRSKQLSANHQHCKSPTDLLGAGICADRRT